MSNSATSNSIIDLIGQTPLIRLINTEDKKSCQLWGKVEGFNPGHSAKDRIVKYILEKAQKAGKIKPGDTIVEATSGNTGFSLAMWCARNGYKCVLTLTTKTSKDKLSLLRALGAEVKICPSYVHSEDPRSYYTVAKTLCESIDNAYYLNQNFDTANADAHYHSTGPEIWEQTKGKITKFICAAGTGGTLCGTARFLKEKNPDIEIIAVDAKGSVLQKYFEEGVFDLSEAYSYRVEGLGKTIIPGNFDTSNIDRMIKVGDKESAFAARQLAMDEAILCGYSSGAVVCAAKKLMVDFLSDDVVVLLFSDHGSRYLSKIYSDDWMMDQGFMDEVQTEDERSGSTAPRQA